MPVKRRRLRLPKRNRVPWSPEWNNELRGWAFNYIVKNKWRCEYIHSMPDLMQDAYLTFEKCKATYPRIMEPRHFMAVFKSSIRNMIMDKARACRNRINHIDEAFDVGKYDVADHAGNLGELAVLIEHGPPELKLFLKVMQDDACLVKLRVPRKRGDPIKNLNMKVAELLGIEYFPFLQAFRELLTKN